MKTVKVRCLKTGVVKEVQDNIASDYLGTKEYELYLENKSVKTEITEEKPIEIKLMEEKPIEIKSIGKKSKHSIYKEEK